MRISGAIQAQDEACEDDELVVIRRRIHGTTAFKEFRTTRTDDDGIYELRVRVTRSADYRAVAPVEGSCDEARSGDVAVLAKVVVTVTGSGDHTPARDERIVISGKVRPNHRGDKVELQRKKGTRWVRVDTDKLSRKSQYRFVLDADWNERATFRIVWPTQDDDHEKGVSRSLRYAAT